MAPFSVSRPHGFAVLWACLIGIHVSSATYAGVLSDFERDATHSDKGATSASASTQSKSVARSSASASENTTSAVTVDGEPLGWLIVKAIFGLMVVGGGNSYEYAMGGVNPSGLPAREKGDALVPFFRVDAGKHFVSNAIDGSEWGAQVGVGPFALNFRYNAYEEFGVAKGLVLQQWQFAYRMIATQNIGLGVWMGPTRLMGEASHKGFAMHFPVDWRVTSHLVLAADLGLHSNKTGGFIDNSVEARYGTRYNSFYAGYRWIESDNYNLNGPMMGMSFYY